MIKNLFTALGMTLIYTPIANTPSTITQNFSIESILTPTTKGNVYTEYYYYGNDPNNEITGTREFATIDYTEYKKNNISIKARARVITTRLFVEDEYEVSIDLMIRTTTTLNIDNTGFYITQSPPDRNKADLGNEYTYYQYGYYNSLTNQQLAFLNGYNYQSDWIKNLNMNTGKTVITESPYDEIGEYLEYDITPKNTYALRLDYMYNESLITDNGASLLNNKDIIQKIEMVSYYTAEIDPTTYEVIDLPGLMFEILGMPFAWLSIAFNFTLFPGTPYAINISHILLGLLVSLIAIIIFRLIMKGR